ncbi:MAG: hypothetical protein OXU81_13170 [Gammaproteobacteria bacterium]|nr:hypothetical protein [Gammaproteobacteria bacterium]
MEFKAFNFELATLEGQWRNSFWQMVNEETANDVATTENRILSKTCGCYIFTIRNGRNHMPWYVGKAETQSFSRRFQSQDHGRLLNDLSENYHGRLVILLLPALTPGGKFRMPQSTQAIRELETMFIGMALKKNPDLLNVQGAALLRDMYVPGVINPCQGDGAAGSVQALRSALDLT